ncbi:type I restriction enzyme HsdR N-terminal domain-containing protein [Microvirga thermotolerans]|nr:type I restriction enzyme HsdR N-terminal domain-containing protein [Microvirga thermotolerans]
MNEADVRETIVRPFLHALGYAHNSPNHIRTEMTLRYSRAFLGRKKPGKDPKLEGRADYMCEVISHGRWIVEVKAADHELSLDDSEQAYTYAAHPEIAAFYYVLTNGWEFKVYRIGEPREPLLHWRLAETDERFSVIRNILGPRAIKERAKRDAIELEKPLAEGLRSRVKIVGGFLTYSDHMASNPRINSALKQIAGSRAPVIGREVTRSAEGLLRADIEIANSNSALDAIAKAAGFESYVFESAQEYVSTDREHPTIFQNIAAGEIPSGTASRHVPGVLPMQMPFSIKFTAFTEAVGFVEDNVFQGTFSILYELRSRPEELARLPVQFRAAANLLRQTQIGSAGEFQIHVV